MVLKFDLSTVKGNIPERFAGIVKEYGSRPAVIEGARRLNYSELDARSNSLAWTILRTGIPAENPVAIIVNQGIDFVTAVFGVLKSGHFYLPIDVEIPVERIKNILKESGTQLVISDSLSGHSFETFQVLDIRALGMENRVAPSIKIKGSDKANLLYTSGSTGTPKGVLQSHENILHNVYRHSSCFEIKPQDRQSLIYPVGVYGGNRDIFNALLNGASIYHFPLLKEGFLEMSKWIQEQKITILCTVATVFRHMIKSLNGEMFSSVRIVKLGGETVFSSDFQAFKQYFSTSCRLSCGLASTELGAVCQNFFNQQSEAKEDILPCGNPIQDIDLKIYDEKNSVFLEAGTGEIVVSSPFITLGYWRRPDLNKKVFTIDENGVRWFRTGDLGTIDEKGKLHHRGRKDQQVKIRGNRVEIPEIEYRLLQIKNVTNAAVLWSRDANLDCRLTAFIETVKNLDEVTVRRTLKQMLPSYMIPADVVILPSFPLTTNGKIDREGLRREIRPSPKGTSEYFKDGTTEERILALWKNFFNSPNLGLNSNFFEMGWNSLQMVELMVIVNQEFKTRLPLSTLIEAPTVRELAKRISSQNDSKLPQMGESLVNLQSGKRKTPIIFVGPNGGNLLPFYRLVYYLDKNIPVYGLQDPYYRNKRKRHLSIEELAKSYLDEVLALFPDGKFILAGWSFGAFVAHEMNRQLQLRNKEAVNCLYFDADLALCGVSIFKIIRSGELFWRLMKNNVFSWEVPYFIDDTIFNIDHSLKSRMEKPGPFKLSLKLFSRLFLRLFKATKVIKEAEERPDLWRYENRSRLRFIYLRFWNTYSMMKFKPKPVRYPITLIRVNSASKNRPSLGWEKLTQGPVSVRRIPDCSHIGLFRPPHVQKVAQYVNDFYRTNDVRDTIPLRLAIPPVENRSPVIHGKY